ncbi:MULTISPECIES: 1-(5-phosphoribosyl)-5-[(5-phosphoribosylamino)methylideneamino]imidazole-4-carboxamide isomerase [Kurthia]|uniref:1-(5-phosphoribosyl)-5-[(5- phosphoribosylamino)methylideneamino]imidazole-4- carboxamide isomerase n=1 Tax=Kurthia TaxID=1649 RepID=UPI000745CDDC|nr:MULTISPECIES: 1-(5-phosphoribosyl)-5-[(5-phosphoribosylamino)methylideneamino]imidazole-4-carboxamide isomerase [Kurthia]AMA63875.1 1-(5-phosphoribosyl)-5-[(5-phosphoribosylamino)methylideneamino]imidazole-4-carboxamide isomerase [Kurthia sp. 11kri321]MEB6113372.1 1-(5-phosphoribosyl)-5-[(5-phosphoribosylamino)methylideneamino]imidazole-4-carboxamide isomerase [Kurthia gibsonii]MEB7772468.1 1-(5-phosphoribosyl)-5-[(5-phosphoribosylamino)methylideneamino]imidazole-4-carboxamide isomerase [Kurt
MTAIQIFPAIDMRGGKCVRLFKGDYAQETIYGDSPFDMAKSFADAGATFIHMVDLDGAKDGERVHAKDVVRVAKELPLRVQIGGGIRTEEDVAFYLDQGVDRVIIGSLAIREPELVASFIEKYGAERIVIGLDAKDGMVATHGWLETSNQTAIEVGQYFASKGAKHFIFTDIATDGTLQGPNIEANEALARATGANIIVSGGMSSLADIQAVKEAAKSTTIAGVIIGKALYTGQFTLEEALKEAE